MIDEIHQYSIDRDKRVIYLHQIEEDDSISYRTSHMMFKNLDILNSQNSKDILLKMISVEGGDVGHGMSIYSAIQNSKSLVNIECYGLTASAGTIILQAGNWRGVSEHGTFMLHFGSTSFDANIISVESYVNTFKFWRSHLIDIYANRCVNGQFFQDRKYSLAKVKNYINTKLKNQIDWWITDPQEVVDYGFADYIIGHK